jgi:hypothetical protein
MHLAGKCFTEHWECCKNRIRGQGKSLLQLAVCTGGPFPWTKELKDTNPLMSSLLVICLGWCDNFVGSESGQKQSVKLLQNMVYITIQHPPPPPQSHTLAVYTVHFSLGRGGIDQREVEGQQYTSIVPSSMVVTVYNLGRKYNPLSECISSQ